MIRVVAALAAVAACRVAPPVPPAPPHSEVRVQAETCIEHAAAEAAIARVLADHHANLAGLVVEIGATPTDAGADVSLRVVRVGGDVGLDRSYALGTADCASAAPLLALAVDRWLTAFPEWAEPPPPPMPKPARWYAAALEGALGASTPPLGAEGEAGAFGDYGGERDRFGVSAIARTGWPHSAGGGRIREITALAGAVWRHRFDAWELRGELRGGVLRVNGLGFSSDRSAYLAWWEIAAFGGRRFSWGSLGVELAASANRDHAVTQEGLVSQSIPFVRLGFSASFGLFGR